jgi:uncharacterized spore protein YtfJ
MSVSEILRTVSDSFQASATVKNVYGEAITSGDRTVIPVARIAYAFGGGGGDREGEQSAEGGGGGGRVSAGPAGALEISPAGTRFVYFNDWRKLASALTVTFAFGLLVGTRRRRP